MSFPGKYPTCKGFFKQLRRKNVKGNLLEERLQSLLENLSLTLGLRAEHTRFHVQGSYAGNTSQLTCTLELPLQQLRRSSPRVSVFACFISRDTKRTSMATLHGAEESSAGCFLGIEIVHLLCQEWPNLS